jgi:serine phosphatase RsbU (regulator of sigma subunit)
MLGISLLNEIVKREGLLKPDEILNLLRIHLINALQQEAVGNDIRDGMDISLCSLYKEYPEAEDYILEYAGAHNPALIFTPSINSLALDNNNNDSVFLEEQNGTSAYMLRADLMPISMHFKIEPFSRKTIRVRSNDMIYLYTDGITDQIGGPEYKKMSSARLRNTLLNVYGETTDKQLRVLEQDLIDWMNYPDPISGSPCDQIDDICVLGVRIP